MTPTLPTTVIIEEPRPYISLEDCKVLLEYAFNKNRDPSSDPVKLENDRLLAYFDRNGRHRVLYAMTGSSGNSYEQVQGQEPQTTVVPRPSSTVVNSAVRNINITKGNEGICEDPMAPGIGETGLGEDEEEIQPATWSQFPVGNPIGQLGVAHNALKNAHLLVPSNITTAPQENRGRDRETGRILLVNGAPLRENPSLDDEPSLHKTPAAELNAFESKETINEIVPQENVEIRSGYSNQANGERLEEEPEIVPVKVANRGKSPTTQTGFACHCQKTFLSKEELERHQKVSHPKEQGKLQCPKCEALFRKEQDRKRHVEVCHKEGEGVTQYRCEECPEISYSSKRALTDHKKRLHGLQATGKNGTGEVKFKCSYCGKAFQWKQNLERHVDTVHLGIKPFTCDKCGLSFGTKSNMNVHVCGRAERVQAEKEKKAEKKTGGRGKKPRK